VAVVQYTFTHKQYTEQHNKTEYTEQNNTKENTQNRIHRTEQHKTEYTEQNIHNIKNT